jgi:chromosome segregation ATPase
MTRGRFPFMSVVPFSASPGSDAAAPEQTDATDARQRMLIVKQKLDEAASELETVQSNLASQQDLEQLLKQGRTHLQELRNRLQQTAAERDQLQVQLAESAKAHQHAIEQIERQMDDQREALQAATGERNRVALQFAEQEAAHQRFAEERSAERDTFKRLLDEASFNQRELMQELDEQRQQLETLREAAMRAQNFAREIMRAHESATHPPTKPR